MRFRALSTTAELFELSHKSIPFVTGCGHRNYVDFSMYITWISGRGYPMERNYGSSHAATFRWWK